MARFCPYIYIGTESCDLIVLDSTTGAQLYLSKTLALGTTLSEHNFGQNQPVGDVAVDKNGIVYLADATYQNPITFTGYHNTIEKLDGAIDRIGEFGPSLTGLGIRADSDMSLAIGNRQYLFLLAWTNQNIAFTQSNRILNLYKIDLNTGALVDSWSNLSFDVLFALTTISEDPHTSMDMADDFVVYYTTYGAHVFRFDTKTGIQLPPLVTVDGADPGRIYAGAIRVRPDQSFLVSVQYDNYAPKANVTWGEIHLYDKHGNLVRTFTKTLNGTGGDPFIPLFGLALGEDDDVFWADEGAFSSLDGVFTYIDKWRISTGALIMSARIRSNEGQTFEPPIFGVSSINSCRTPVGGASSSWISTALIGA